MPDVSPAACSAMAWGQGGLSIPRVPARKTYGVSHTGGTLVLDCWDSPEPCDRTTAWFGL